MNVANLNWKEESNGYGVFFNGFFRKANENNERPSYWVIRISIMGFSAENVSFLTYETKAMLDNEKHNIRDVVFPLTINKQAEEVKFTEKNWDYKSDSDHFTYLAKQTPLPDNGEYPVFEFDRNFAIEVTSLEQLTFKVPLSRVMAHKLANLLIETITKHNEPFLIQHVLSIKEEINKVILAFEADPTLEIPILERHPK